MKFKALALGKVASLNTVTRRLVALVLLMLVPITLIAMLAALALYGEERKAVVAAASATGKALSLVVDRELGERAAILRTLATSPALERGDLEAFYREAALIAPHPENAIMLVDLQGRQLFNTRMPYGQGPLPDSMPFRQIAEQSGGWRHATTVSGLYLSPLVDRYSFAVQVPVVQQGQVRWVLGLSSVASELQRIFAQQPLPAAWVGSIVDANGILVARTVRAGELVGRRATPDMLETMQRSPSGQLETVTLDGVPVLTVYTRTPEFGWAVLIGLSQEELRRPALRALGTVFGAALLVTLIAAGVAFWIGRGIVGPVRQLHDDALALGRGDPIAEAPTGLLETDTVRRLLAQAGRERTQADEHLRARVAEAVADAERAQRAALTTQKLEALGRLTGGIAHDFNNLLQTMTTGLQLARRLAGDDRARAALAACDSAVSKAVQLTRQLMTFGRAQPGHLEVVDLHAQFDDIAALLQGAVRDDVTVRIDLHPDIGVVRVDPVQLELAVLNLTLNARDALQGRRGTVEITATPRVLHDEEVPGLHGGSYVRLAVKDDGEGIAPELLQRVFEPFFTTKPVGRGSGLGLAQVYGFALAAGGMATVQSRVGAGTCVTLWLPVASGHVAARPSAPAPLDGARHEGTVLLVEDDPLVRDLVAHGLEDHGFRVCVAANADEALSLARSRPDIDVVLSDIVMPGGQSGIDLLKTLRVIRPALPVLLASGYADALDREVDVPVIAKPYQVAEVASRLARAISGSVSSFGSLETRPTP